MVERLGRAVIERVTPEIDAGRFPIKRALGESVRVEADVFADGHDVVAARVLHRPAGDKDWRQVPMRPLGNDRWWAEFQVDQLGSHHYTVQAWVDYFQTWLRDLRSRLEAGQDLSVDLRIGAELVGEAGDRARGDKAAQLKQSARQLATGDGVEHALEPRLAELMQQPPDQRFATAYERELVISVDPELARFSAWYEMFPRSAAAEPGDHGTLRDVERQLPYVAGMGFDILYLPPIHPIGSQYRKGPNNNVAAVDLDVGSPWAIGGPEGGHKAVHPKLGTLADFQHLVAEAERHGLKVALDVAFQASPDHPYVKDRPEWFRHRPDGTIQYAENPPKRYQDIYPFDFSCADWRELWRELCSIFEFWIEQGVSVFRVDNPHTKPFQFWEWTIGCLKAQHPELIFLAEAFTRPKVMYRLAKLGFNQSYTYFAWRDTASELREYMTELTRTEVSQFFRPNFWPNTPDILTEALQVGGRNANALRLVLAATLTASYGIFGPAFELADNRPLGVGREDYLDSEKYQVRHWDRQAPRSLRHLIARVNRIRHEHPALQQDRTLRFLATDNERLLAYAKTAGDGSDAMVIVVNLDPRWRQSGWIELPALTPPGRPEVLVHDVLNGDLYVWNSVRWNYVELDPAESPAHILSVDARLRPEI
ncbi:MAG: alpha-1,4-glucan--maltose-1-phosphate maltosyltransferase [Candidatus Dormibacter sp.]|uniref:alpha-1,4-glucan--maltose-1-phosphate maltosyltransferase n=1 Tax=Candidatus Dormibacter sp. TaxID=2973982 RepID=UPI000DB00454|nr:MAG: alpha-1,4-glucan--maltose-1-phosphate maltosyltransferase [Candidatus Dormibacteraeota bacterium]